MTGRDRRFRWLYNLIGATRGSQFAALWGVLTGKRTFTLRALPRAIDARADVYHAHDLINLEIAHGAALATGGKFVYDSHEFFPDVDNTWIRLKRGYWKRHERELMPRAHLTITVNEIIAKEMAHRNNAPVPIVILNCPDPPPDFDPTLRYTLLKDRLGIDHKRKIVLYHGWIAKGRGLEDLVRAAPLLVDGAVVVLLGHGDYRLSLQRLADEVAPERAFTLPAVPYRELLPNCASADVGMIPIQAKGLNYYYTAPNRLFDFIQASVPIVANNLPYLRQVIVTNDLGIVAPLDSPDTYAQAINKVLSLPDNGETFRANMRRVAPQYTWKVQAEKLVHAYSRL